MRAKPGGIQHFGFRLTDPADIDKAVTPVAEACGAIRSRGEFCPGEPYVFFSDPDGYEVEIWYEPEHLTCALVCFFPSFLLLAAESVCGAASRRRHAARSTATTARSWPPSSRRRRR